MEILTGIFIFLLGIAIGSFLNVVALRYNTGRSINGRSFCFSCGKTLCWYELIPVFSFIAQRGKCRNCGSRLSWQYPTVELLTGLMFLALFFKLNADISLPLMTFSTLFIYHAVILSILIVIFVYDLRHKIIPDGLVYAFIVLSFVGNFLGSELQVIQPDFLNLLAGPLLFLPFFILWFASGGRWMGFGDAKLAWGIGWYLGLVYGATAVIIAFWIGAAVALIILSLGKLSLSPALKKLTIKSEIPFAPFLILGILVAFFFNLDIFSVMLFVG